MNTELKWRKAHRGQELVAPGPRVLAAYGSYKGKRGFWWKVNSDPVMRGEASSALVAKIMAEANSGIRKGSQ